MTSADFYRLSFIHNKFTYIFSGKNSTNATRSQAKGRKGVERRRKEEVGRRREVERRENSIEEETKANKETLR